MGSVIKKALRRALPPRIVASFRRRVLRRPSELPVVEALLTSHCNLSCKYCNAFAPLSEPGHADAEQFDRDIHRLAQLFDRISNIGIVGGEPLLHPSVTRFMQSARSASPTARIYLVSNGLLLSGQPAEFWAEMKRQGIELDVSCYDIKVDRARIAALAAGHGVPLKFFEERQEFWNFPIRPEGTCDRRRSFEACRALVKCPAVVNGRLYLCGRVPVAHIFEKAAGLNLPVTSGDYVDIYGDVDGYLIQERLMSPLDWCRYCDAEGKRVADWETGARTAEEWM